MIHTKESPILIDYSDWNDLNIELVEMQTKIEKLEKILAGHTVKTVSCPNCNWSKVEVKQSDTKCQRCNTALGGLFPR